MSAVLHSCCRSKFFRIDLRRLSSSYSSMMISQIPNSDENPANFNILGLIPPFQLKPRNFSSTANSPDTEIAPPGTVKRDPSPLANETRQVLDDTMRTMYGLSRVAAALGVVQIGIGGWVYYHCITELPSPPLTSEVSAAAASYAMTVTFPMCLSFILRRRLRPMFFVRKMEEEGRMQILKLNLQVAKSMNLMFARLRSVSCVSASGLASGFICMAVFDGE